MKEVFKKIDGYERYSVSNYGRVINNETGLEISQRIASNGYMRVNVRKGDVKYEKPKTISVHRLVAEYFIENPCNKPYVNHIDCNKKNNHVTNLEWCTEKENSIHAYENIKGYADLCNENLKKAQAKCGKKVRVIKDGVVIAVCGSKREAAKLTGVSEKTIYNRLNKRFTTRSEYDFEEVV